MQSPAHAYGETFQMHDISTAWQYRGGQVYSSDLICVTRLALRRLSNARSYFRERSRDRRCCGIRAVSPSPPPSSSRAISRANLAALRYERSRAVIFLARANPRSRTRSRPAASCTDLLRARRDFSPTRSISSSPKDFPPGGECVSFAAAASPRE